MTVRIDDAAEAELGDAARWYEARQTGLGERLLAEAVVAFEDIARHPERYARVKFRTRRDLRRRTLRHFPYSIIYELRSSECLVVAVAHASRRQAYWRNRLP